MTDARCRVTVVGAENRIDLALPAETPIAEYNDALARMCGQPVDDTLPPAWSLAPAVGAPYPLTSSLAAEGVEDGAVLYLRDTLAGEDKEPTVRTVWEVVSDLAQDPAATRWDVRAVGRLAVIVGQFWLVAALVYHGLAGHRGVLLNVLAGVAGVGAAVLARVLKRYPRVLPGRLRTLLACGAIPCTALIAFLAPGSPALDLTHLFYLEVGLLVGCVIALVAVPGVLLSALTVLAGIATILTAVPALTHASGAAVSATVVVAGVLFLAAAPRLAGALVAGSWLSPSSSTVEPQADPEQLAERVVQARRVLVLLVSVASVATGAGLIALTVDYAPFTLAVAITATAVLFLRAGTFRLAPEGVLPVIAGTIGLLSLLTLPGRAGGPDAYELPVLLMLGLVAMGVGVPVLLWGAGRSPAPDTHSSKLGPVLTVSQIVLPALLLGVYGLYETLWNVGR
ncbi:EsaB/YukD family protein [Actinoplanes sp. NPDC048796]|uniref:EsaB/YukD family protein n=1 Tax=Actinoplanes sp. NPDC048796 TaxID=3155640 RepID=UPI0033DAAC26